jgi:Na+/H+-dicarboxylate symporter
MKKFKLKLWQKILIGMLLGILTGALDPSLFGYKVHFLVEPFGILFSNLLKMIVIPLIFFAILYGITSIDDADTFNRLGGRAMIIYSLTTIFAVTIGIVFTLIFEPGVGVKISLHSGPAVKNTSSLYNFLVNIIPSNPIEAMVQQNTLQVVVFAFFLGVSIILIGNKSQALKEVIISTTQVMFKMVELILKTAPLGVFAIMTGVIAKYGLDLLLSLANFALVVMAALFLQYLLFGLMLLAVKLNPLPFYKKMLPVQALAFATSSSKATLPMAMEYLNKQMGVSKRSAGFILPLGASMNMDATAIYLGATAVFFAQVMAIALTLQDYLIIVLTATIGSIGAAGFPGGGIVMMGIVLSSVGLPVEGVSLIVGIDRLLDMMRTAINITGDCTVTVIVDKMEGTFNKASYNKDRDLL